jgi:hypothetical protein
MLPHFHKKAMDFLNYKFPENVIGLWPPCLPDLTPLDIYFGEWYIKDAVCMPPLATTLLGGLQLQWQQLPLTCLIMYELKLNTGMIPARPLSALIEHL